MSIYSICAIVVSFSVELAFNSVALLIVPLAAFIFGYQSIEMRGKWDWAIPSVCWLMLVSLIGAGLPFDEYIKLKELGKNYTIVEARVADSFPGFVSRDDSEPSWTEIEYTTDDRKFSQTIPYAYYEKGELVKVRISNSNPEIVDVDDALRLGTFWYIFRRNPYTVFGLVVSMVIIGCMIHGVWNHRREIWGTERVPQDSN